jgi:flagellar FliJ protein
MGQLIENQSQFGINADVARASSSPIKGDARNLRALERLNRLRELEVQYIRRRCTQIEVMIADFDGIARQLEGEVRAEQGRTGIHDPAHFAYSTSAAAMTRRRDNLKRSMDELERQLAEAKVALE